MKESKKLISARIDSETLKKIEEFCVKYRYWKRNYVIDRILYAVLEDLDEKDIYDMVRRPHWRIAKVVAKYEIVASNINSNGLEDGKDS